MTRRNGGKLTHGELKDAAQLEDVDPEQSYEELRSALDITECRWCGAEFVHGWSEKFCTDQCEVDHINEYHRD